MATATMDTQAHRAKRAALQAKLKNYEQTKAAKLRAGEELVMAQQMVAKFERVPGYVRSFEVAFSRAAQEFCSLNSDVPNELRNTCTDQRLKDEWEQVTAIRERAIRERDNTRSNLKRAQQDLASTIARISLQRGEPAILGPNDELPWSESWISKKFTKMQISLGHVPNITWAIRDDNSAIAFSPAVREQDAAFYAEQFNDDLRSVRMAQAAFDLALESLASADEAKADIKSRMVWSPI